MNVSPLEPRLSGEENAVSALLRLEENYHQMAYFRRIRVPSSVWPAWFFALKLIYELESLLATETERGGPIHMAHWYACQVRARLRKVRSGTECYNPAVEHIFVEIECLIETTREKMNRLIVIYPGVVEPDLSYHIEAIYPA